MHTASQALAIERQASAQPSLAERVSRPKTRAILGLMRLNFLSVLSAFKKRFDPRRFNGAALLGLRGLVFKSHGSADAFSFEQAMNRAYDAARNQLLDRVRQRIAHAAPLLMQATETAAEPVESN
jgi:fatty acid/phospholipid biosynthesis enzyme